MTYSQEYWWFADCLKTATPLVIGLTLAYISWQQWRTNRYKVKLDLYDRRYKIFEATWTFIFSLIKYNGVNQADWQTFNRDTYAGHFLFGRGVREFLKSMEDGGRKALFPENDQEKEKFIRQLMDAQHQIEIVFRKYFDVSKVI